MRGRQPLQEFRPLQEQRTEAACEQPRPSSPSRAKVESWLEQVQPGSWTNDENSWAESPSLRQNDEASTTEVHDKVQSRESSPSAPLVQIAAYEQDSIITGRTKRPSRLDVKTSVPRKRPKSASPRPSGQRRPFRSHSKPCYTYYTCSQPSVTVRDIFMAEDRASKPQRTMSQRLRRRAKAFLKAMGNCLSMMCLAPDTAYVSEVSCFDKCITRVDLLEAERLAQGNEKLKRQLLKELRKARAAGSQ